MAFELLIHLLTVLQLIITFERHADLLYMMLRFIPDHDLNLELTEYGSPVSIMEPTNLLA